MATTLYVRNTRPNRVILKYADLRHILERRGSREDSWSLPIEAQRDPDISRLLRIGVLEEIDKETFLTLAERDGPGFSTPEERGSTEPPVKPIGLREFDLPMSSEEESRRPNIVPKEFIDPQARGSKLKRTPRLEHQHAVQPSSVEAAQAEVRLARIEPARKPSEFTPDSNASLTRQVQALQEQLSQLMSSLGETPPPAPYRPEPVELEFGPGGEILNKPDPRLVGLGPDPNGGIKGLEGLAGAE